MRRIAAFVFATLCFSSASSSAEDTLTTDRWLRHMNDELLPFWSHPDAFGDPVGLFPTSRCNDGALPAVGPECPDGKSSVSNRTYMFPLSRQVFAYGAAFHLTGDKRYLDLAQAGLKVLLGPAAIPGGGHHDYYVKDADAWGPGDGSLNIQKQLYIMLGPAFLYYLTRDPELFSEIEAMRLNVIDKYFDAETGAYHYRRNDRKTKPKDFRFLVAGLDQLNTFYALLAPYAPPDAAESWRSEMRLIAKDIENRFYNEAGDVYEVILSGEDQPAVAPDIQFGHSAKAAWLLAATGAFLGDDAMVERAVKKGERLLVRSFSPETGAWRPGEGDDKSVLTSFSFVAQSQLAHALAISDQSVRKMLIDANAFWFDKFVDHEHGGTFGELTLQGEDFDGAKPKHWRWKSGFHTFDLALFGYLASAGISGAKAELYYGFGDTPPETPPHPYQFGGDVVSAEPLDNGVWIYRFENIRFPR